MLFVCRPVLLFFFVCLNEKILFFNCIVFFALLMFVSAKAFNQNCRKCGIYCISSQFVGYVDGGGFLIPLNSMVYVL
jgi:hypothetical protein